ncbi:MAG TPA: hypothetical protein VGP93_19800, partial [Polyangiaceae bacterium]|nr:hypothetical protein [Polyangiaceae bacterium]
QLFCVPGPMPEKVGQFYTNCPTGAECDQESGFFCRSAGVGDLDSYCTASCTDDEQCPSGFLCDTVSGTPCEDDCDVAGDAADPECVPSSEIGDGKAYRCGLLGIERNICVKRRFCADCETDDDCRAVPGLICAKDASGEKICTPPCDPNLDSCPWGNAATCGVWDDERGIATCTHRFQSCHGSGLPCEPCYRQSDCGSNGICSGSTFTGERYCVDLNVQCSCQGEPVSAEGLCVGGGCPESPGGLEMQCYIGASGNGPGVCLFANANPNPLLASPQTGCWGPL